MIIICTCLKKNKNKKKQDEITTDPNEFNEWIIKEERDIDKELFNKHFGFQRPSDMFKRTNDKIKNNELVSAIDSGLKELKEEIKNMS